MSALPASLERLTDALRRLPGVGPKSAQRIAWHLLQHDREGARQLSSALSNAVERVHRCTQCNTFTEQAVCETCLSPKRDRRLLCVVETPADQLMIEQTLSFSGLYFVLMGRVSPLDGHGAKEIHLERLVERAIEGEVQEVIIATNFTTEGEATAHFIAQALRKASVGAALKITRLARGVPSGGELEYVDLATIAQALMDRRVADD